MERQEIAENLKWKTSDVFNSDEAWEEEFKKVEKEYFSYDYAKFKGKLADKESLLACLKLSDEVAERLEKLYLYAHLKNDQDLRESKYSSYLGKVMSSFSSIFAQLSFVDPELTSLDESVLQAFISDPDFKEYDYKLRRIADSKAHVLSEAEEKLLTLSSEVMRGFQTVFTMLNNTNLNLPKATLGGEEVQMSHGLYGVALHSTNAKEREEWFKKYYESYIKLIDGITQTYNGNVKKDVFFKTVKNYDTCLSMALDGEDVQPIVYNNLIEAVHEALPTLHEYIRTRKKVLGFSEQHMYDMMVPLVEDAEIKLPFET